MTKIEKAMGDKAQARADYTGEAHVVVTYTDGLIVTRPIDQYDGGLADGATWAAAGIKKVVVYSPSRPGQITPSASDILKAAAR